jgi:hypothetical protein
MKNFLRFAASTTCMLFIFSCQKEAGDLPGQQNPACKLGSAYYYTPGGGMYDSSVFVYTGDKAMKAESELKSITYTYAGANISTRNFFDKIAKSVAFIDTAEYDGNKLKRLTVWQFPGQFANETTRIIHQFNYNGNNIDRIITARRVMSTNTTDTAINIFRVNGSGNIDNIITVDKNGTLYDSVHYAYDNNPNYFTKIHPNYFLFDVNFQLQGNYLHHLPYFLSANNVREFSYGGNNTYQVTYAVDSLKNLNSVSVSGQPYAEYRYDCK